MNLPLSLASEVVEKGPAEFSDSKKSMHCGSVKTHSPQVWKKLQTGPRAYCDKGKITPSGVHSEPLRNW